MFLTSIFLISTSLTLANPTECDRLAASPHDLQKISEPIDYVLLRQHSQMAVENCKEALKSDADNPRLQFQLGRALIAAGNDGEAVEWMRKSAIADYPAAQNAYAVLLNHGRGVEFDNVEALKWLRSSADAGNIRGMANLGAIFGEATGAVDSVNTDFEESIKWLHRAAEKDDPLALARLGWNYGAGDSGVKINKDLSYGFLERALALDEESAHYIFPVVAASFFADQDLAAEHLKKYKDSKNRLVQIDLSNYSFPKSLIEKISTLGFRFDRPDVEPVYIKEFIFDSDEYIAIILDGYLESMSAEARSAAQAFINEVDRKKKLRSRPVQSPEKGSQAADPQVFGEANDCDLLASSPYDQLSVAEPVAYTSLRKNAEDAVRACREVVENAQLNVRAKFLLGRALIAQGRDKEAAKLMLDAAVSGYPAAMNAYGVLLNHGRGVDTDYSESFNWLKKSAELGNPAAAINLATAYFIGLGTDLDSDAGTQWTQIGAERRDPKALFTLGAAYAGSALWYRVVEVRNDFDKGTELLAHAHKMGELDATYAFYQMSFNPNYKAVRKERSLGSGSELFELLLAKGDRRAIAEEKFKSVDSTASMIKLINLLMTKPHPVDRIETEPVYAVDSYMDNEHALGQFLTSNSYDKPYNPANNEDVNRLYKQLEDSKRSFEREGRY